jgi:CubicO group peptidase (beta-lactamase class C family)
VSLANELFGERVCDEQSAADLGGFLASYLDPAGIYYAPENFAPERPGTHFEYSNVGAALAGHLVELATGTSLAEYARERFFEPLGLAHTSFRLSELAPSSVAIPHLRDPETGASAPIPLYELSTWPDGGLRSSVNDFGTLLAAVMSGGALDGVRILEQSSVTTALDPLASLDDETDIGVFWILGSREVLPQDAKPRNLVFHDGGDPGAFSYVLFDRNAGVGLVILANGDFGDGTGSEELLAELVEELFALAVERADAALSSR